MTGCSWHLRALLAALALSACGLLGCDQGGLLVLERVGNTTGPAVKGHGGTEFVTGGTVAKNDKYKVVYTTGQPTPQGVAKSPSERVNGGLPGSVSSP